MEKAGDLTNIIKGSFHFISFDTLTHLSLKKEGASFKEGLN